MRFSQHKAGVVGLVFIALLILLAIAVPIVSSHDPAAMSGDVMAPPSRVH